VSHCLVFFFFSFWAACITLISWDTSDTFLIDKIREQRRICHPTDLMGSPTHLTNYRLDLSSNTLESHTLLSNTQAGFRNQKDTSSMSLEDACFFKKDAHTLILDFTSDLNTTDHDQMPCYS